MSDQLIKYACEKIEYLKNNPFNSQDVTRLLGELDKTDIDNFSQRIDIIIKILNILWVRHEKGTIMAQMHDWKRIEQFIYPSEKHYRDHLQHQLYVYLLGSVVIELTFEEAFYDIYNNLLGLTKDNSEFTMKNAKNEMHFVWMMSSTFHDYAYPIEKFNLISNRISEFFWEEYRSEVGIYSKLKLSVEHKIMFDELVKNIESINNSDDMFFIDDFLQNGFLNRDHGIYSGMILIPKIMRKIDQSYITKNNKKLWIAATRTMALHNYRIKHIKVQNDPLLALLIICDEIQDWDRMLYYFEKEQDHDKVKNNFKLSQLKIDNSCLDIELINDEIDVVPNFIINNKNLISEFIIPKKSTKNFSINLTYKTKNVNNTFNTSINFLSRD